MACQLLDGNVVGKVAAFFGVKQAGDGLGITAIVISNDTDQINEGMGTGSLREWGQVRSSVSCIPSVSVG